ncbi:unnamed protein product [Caenorhabditis angaria]|uniref:Uncharacterized protein n=1 Tax=Caenorhabditis angaria TaxID=860376 RepID=A0A9P1N452_9PELO|nr:unnamed protein product [Caenorhabditis angaria]
MGNLSGKQSFNGNTVTINMKQAQAMNTALGPIANGKTPCQVAQLALAAPDEKSHSIILFLIKASTEAQISDVCAKAKIPVQAKNEAIAAFKNGNYDRAATILVEAARQKLRESSSELSGASGGRRMIKSEHGTYMRAYDQEWKVDLMHGEPRDWEHWYIEDWVGKVVFKAIHCPGRFLRACSNGNVDLVGSHPNDCRETFWKPFKNSDETWSFLSVHGTWLSGLGNNVVCCMWECKSSEKFTLPWW